MGKQWHHDTLVYYSRRSWWVACAIIYLWFFASSALYAWRHPFLNWDMIAYIGVAESFSHGDTQGMYDATMEEIGQAYSPRQYYHLRAQSPLSNNPEAFHQQLPFYSVKPLYTAGIWLLHALGLPMAEASYLLSILGFLSLGAICFAFVPKGWDAGLWWLAVTLFCYWGPMRMPAMARLSTPDALCIALCVAGYCFWVYRQSFISFTFCFILAQLSRPDTILLSVALAMVFVFFAPTPYRLTKQQALGFALGAIGLYFAVNALTGNYGWKTLFYYKFIRLSAYPAQLAPVFSLQQYIGIVRYGIVHMLTNARLQCLISLSLAGIFLHFSANIGNRLFVNVLAAVWLAFLIRFMVFPAWGEDRYYYPYYFLMIFAVAEILPSAIRIVRQDAINPLLKSKKLLIGNP